MWAVFPPQTVSEGRRIRQLPAELDPFGELKERLTMIDPRTAQLIAPESSPRRSRLFDQ